MATIQNVVQVVIEKQTNQITISDLNTVAVLSEHTRFAEDSRIYTNPADLLTDGFLVGDFAYKAALLLFSQDVRPTRIVVGKKLTSDSYTVAINKLITSNNAWLFLITDAIDESDVTEVAGVIEATEKYFICSTSEKDTLTTGADGTVAALVSLGYDQTLAMFNENSYGSTVYENADATVPEAAWAGRFAPLLAGSSLWIYKGLDGVQTSALTTTQETNLKDKNTNWYTTISGIDVMYGDNKTIGGEYIDVQLGITWLVTRMRERIFGTMINQRKINFDTAGVALIESNVRAVLQEAIDNNIIAAQPAPQITVPNVLALSSAERNTRNLAGIKFTARLAGAIQTVLDIQGTVYA